MGHPKNRRWWRPWREATCLRRSAVQLGGWEVRSSPSSRRRAAAGLASGPSERGRGWTASVSKTAVEVLPRVTTAPGVATAATRAVAPACGLLRGVAGAARAPCSLRTSVHCAALATRMPTGDAAGGRARWAPRWRCPAPARSGRCSVRPGAGRGRESTASSRRARCASCSRSPWSRSAASPAGGGPRSSDHARRARAASAGRARAR